MPILLPEFALVYLDLIYYYCEIEYRFKFILFSTKYIIC